MAEYAFKDVLCTGSNVHSRTQRQTTTFPEDEAKEIFGEHMTPRYY